MNEYSSSNSSTSTSHHGLTAEAISRRAYELWEQEGRPESRDLHHWLRAEQELLAEQNKGGASAENSRTQNTDQPLQSSRNGAAGRDTKAPPQQKRAGSPSAEKPAPARSTQPGMRTPARS